MGDNEKKDQKIDIKSESTNMYAIAKEKNDNLRKLINDMIERKDKDRFTLYGYIIELLDHANAATIALHDLWTIPLTVEKFPSDTLVKAFDILANVNNELLDLGAILREERKDILIDMPMQKISQKIVDTHLGQMFG